MEDKLKIAICEDTEEDKLKLLRVLDSCDFDLEYTVFESGEDLLKVYAPQKFDLLLMDIYMGGMTGIQTISKIREIDDTVPVAFITTSTDFTLESYRLSALKYIEKNYTKKEIEDVLTLAKLEKDNAPSIRIYKSGKYENLRLSQIMYFEQHSRQVSIYLQSGEVISIYDKISNLLEQISDEKFFDCHKSYAVNFDYVKYIDEELKCFMMENDTNVPIRRNSMTIAKQKFEDFLFSTTRGITK